MSLSLSSLPRRSSSGRAIRGGGLLLLGLLAALLSTGRVSAASLEVRTGFAELAVDHGRAVVRVTVRLEPDDAPVDGRVELLADDSSRPGVFAAPVHVVAGGEATVELVVPTECLDSPVRLVDEAGRVRASLEPKSVARALPTGTEPLILVADRERTGLIALGRSGETGGAQMAVIAPERLPRVARALDGVGLVVLRGLRDELDPAQLRALQRHVETGGVLVLIDAAAPVWRLPVWRPLRPARPGSGKPPMSDAARRALDLDESSPRPLVTRLLPTGADVTLLPEAEGPLAAKRAIGHGAVIMTAFDPNDEGFRTAPKLPAWLLALMEHANGGAGPSGPHRAALGSTLRETSERLFHEEPFHSPLVLLAAALLLLGYALLAGRGVTLLQRRISGLPLVVIVPPLAIGAGLLLMLWSTSMRPEHTLRRLTWEIQVDPSRDEPVLTRRATDLGFHAGGDLEAELTLDPELFPAMRRKSGFERLVTPFAPTRHELHSEHATLGPIALESGGMTWLRLEDIRLETPTLLVSRAPAKDGKGAFLQVENPGPDRPAQLAILYRGKQDWCVRFAPAPAPGDPPARIPIADGAPLESTLESARWDGDLWTLPEPVFTRRLLLEALDGVRRLRPRGSRGKVGAARAGPRRRPGDTSQKAGERGSRVIWVAALASARPSITARAGEQELRAKRGVTVRLLAVTQ